MNSGMQFVTDGRTKFIRYPGTGLEQAFDLSADPQEMVDIAGDPAAQDRIEHLRRIMIRELEGRPEGFVRNGELAITGGPAPSFLPGFASPDGAGELKNGSR